MFAKNKYLFAGLVLISLAACQSPEPTIFSVPKNHWNQLTQDQQNRIITGQDQAQ